MYYHFMGMESFLVGIKAEDIASRYVEKLGYKVLYKNWRCPYGEIDIVAKNDKLLGFFEVKYRKNNIYGYAYESLNYSKISKLKKAINLFLLKFNIVNTSWFLDGLCISPSNNSYKLSHYKNLLGKI